MGEALITRRGGGSSIDSAADFAANFEFVALKQTGSSSAKYTPTEADANSLIVVYSSSSYNFLIYDSNGDTTKLTENSVSMIAVWLEYKNGKFYAYYADTGELIGEVAYFSGKGYNMSRISRK